MLQLICHIIYRTWGFHSTSRAFHPCGIWHPKSFSRSTIIPSYSHTRSPSAAPRRTSTQTSRRASRRSCRRGRQCCCLGSPSGRSCFITGHNCVPGTTMGRLIGRFRLPFGTTRSRLPLASIFDDCCKIVTETLSNLPSSAVNFVNNRIGISCLVHRRSLP